jgi:uncharacterized protein (TIGR02265 family)
MLPAEQPSRTPSALDFHAKYARPLGLVAPYCDIIERLEVAPRTARLRGVLFRAIRDSMAAHGKLDAYRNYFDDEHSAIPYYPLSDYLVRVAVAGALVTSPQTLHEGMYELSRTNAKTVADSLLGRTLIRLLARDPLRLAEQSVAARRQMSSFGRWSLVRHGPTQVEIVQEDEYTWIESALAGAAAGTFQTLTKFAVTLETKLKDPYNGSTFIRW